MISLYEATKDKKTCVILGHERPDGDCVGSALGLRNYLKDMRPEMEIDVCIEEFRKGFSFLEGADKVCHDPFTNKEYEICFVLDCGDETRLGDFISYMKSAKHTVCIDHHITNTGFADECLVDAKASATSEILYSLMDYDKISRAAAECLYLGIVHDTGVFKHSNTTGKTMSIAGALLDKGLNSSYIIDHTFYEKTFRQNKILGQVLLGSERILDDLCIYGVATKEDMDKFGVTKADTDGIIDQLRITTGVEVAIFLTEVKDQEYKVSMRANSIVDVAKICAGYGGGGHVRAAGCSMTGEAKDIIKKLSAEIEVQLHEAGIR